MTTTVFTNIILHVLYLSIKNMPIILLVSATNRLNSCLRFSHGRLTSCQDCPRARIIFTYLLHLVSQHPVQNVSTLLSLSPPSFPSASCPNIVPILQNRLAIADYPVPSRDVTIQPLPGRELFNYSRPGII